MASCRRKKRPDSSRLFSREVCAFCGTKETNEVLYGAFYSTLAISVHHNCMFLASGLSQRGNPNIGIVGFMLPDLEKEISRGQKLHCCYCKKRGATIGCVEAKCKKSFHLPCGIKNGTLHQFFSSFKSFCRHHMPKQAPLEINEDELYCHICYTALTREELQNCLYSPCCRKNWFHKYCLQQYAFNAGMYFIKCPLCNNTTEFINEMKIHGIHIPEKDASWEQEENAFQDLLVRPECGAVVCKCAKGRNHCSERNDEWKLLSCSVCGSHARHIKCEKLSLNQLSWKCMDCSVLETKISKAKIQGYQDKEVGQSTESASNSANCEAEQTCCNSDASCEKNLQDLVKESASNPANCDAGSSTNESDTSWEKKLQDLASKITALNTLQERCIKKSIPILEVYREQEKKSKSLKKQRNLKRSSRKFKQYKPKDISDKCCKLIEYFEENDSNDALSEGLKYPDPNMENLLNDITLYVSEMQNNLQQHLSKLPESCTESDDSEEEVRVSKSSAEGYTYLHSIEEGNRKIWQHLKSISKLTENSENSVVKCKNQDTESKTPSSHTLCSSETVINDRTKKLGVKLNCSNQNQERENKRRKCISATTDFVSRTNLTRVSRNKEPKSYGRKCVQKRKTKVNTAKNYGRKHVQRRKTIVNTAKNYGRKRVQRKKTKVNTATNISKNDFRKHNLKPTPRKTYSKKRSANITPAKLRNTKKIQTIEPMYSHASENSAASLNTLDSFCTDFEPKIKKEDATECETNLTPMCNTLDSFCTDFVPRTKNEDISECEINITCMSLRNMKRINYGTQTKHVLKKNSISSNNSRKHNQQLTPRRTYSKKRSVNITPAKLNKRKKKTKTVDPIHSRALEHSAASLNTLDSFCTNFEPRIKKEDATECETNLTPMCNTLDSFCTDFVPRTKNEDVSECEINITHMSLRNLKRINYGTPTKCVLKKNSISSNNSRKHNQQLTPRRTSSKKRSVNITPSKLNNSKKKTDGEMYSCASENPAASLNTLDSFCTDFVPRIKKEDVTECEINITHMCLRNKERINYGTPTKRVHRKNREVNTANNISSNNFRKENANVTPTKLDTSKTGNTVDVMYSCASENSAASFNTLDRHFMHMSSDAKSCVSQVSSESHVTDFKPAIAIKVEKEDPSSSVSNNQICQNVTTVKVGKEK